MLNVSRKKDEVAGVNSSDLSHVMAVPKVDNLHNFLDGNDRSVQLLPAVTGPTSPSGFLGVLSC